MITVMMRTPRSRKGEEEMKIALLSVHSCPLGKLGGKNTGGMNVYIRELARELGRRGHLMDIYTRAHGSIHNRIIELGPNARIIHLKAGKDKEIEKLAIYPHLVDFASDLDSFRKSCGLTYDLIHSHYWLSGWAGKLIQRWWDVPHITMFHTMGAVKNRIGVGRVEPELRLDTEKELVRDCQRIIAPTDEEKRALITYYGASPATISVVPCGVNLHLFRPLDKEIALGRLGFNGEDIILCVGRIDPLKGIDNLLRAMTYLDRKNIKLVVVGGDGESQSELKNLKVLSRSLRIHDSITFRGLVNQEMLPYFYNAADVCVIPSYYESFGLVALESLACGTPVVATKVGCVESVIHHGETGYVVPDNAPRSLADNIALVLSPSNGKPESRQSIRASVTKFDWSNIADAVVEEYRTVLGNHSSRYANHDVSA
jgi:D-inositol-3-phosphate glycosyltransferase